MGNFAGLNESLSFRFSSGMMTRSGKGSSVVTVSRVESSVEGLMLFGPGEDVTCDDVFLGAAVEIMVISTKVRLNKNNATI